MNPILRHPTPSYPSLSHEATTGLRSDNTTRSQCRISRARLVLHTRARTDVRRERLMPLQQSLEGPHVRKQSRAQSIRLRNRDTWGCGRGGRGRRRPAAGEESSAQVCRARSSRNPRHSAGRPQIRAQRERPPANAIARHLPPCGYWSKQFSGGARNRLTTDSFRVKACPSATLDQPEQSIEFRTPGKVA